MKTKRSCTAQFLFAAMVSVLSIATTPVSAQAAGDLTVTVNNIKSQKGRLIITVYDNEESFDRFDKNFHSLLSLKPTGEKMTVCLKKFPQGRYAVYVFQDINGNEELDFKANQMPLEPYIFSQNVGKWKTPTFRNAEFTHNKKSALHVTLLQS